MSVGINYRRNISVGNSVAFLRFSGSDKPITRGKKLNNNKKYIQRAVKMIREKLSIARRKDSKEEISPAFSSLCFFFHASRKDSGQRQGINLICYPLQIISNLYSLKYYFLNSYSKHTH